MSESWTVIMPVRNGPGSKSRLAAPAALAEAFVADCVAAATDCPRVAPLVVVTGDLPAHLDAELISAPTPGLTAAIDFALDQMDREDRVAVLLPDRPSLRPGDLSAVLEVADEPVFVTDCAGTGTAILAGPAGALKQRFGRGSAARHRAVGARELVGQSPRLRCDVDTPADLLCAWQLGVGPFTSAKLTAVQVTVFSFDLSLGSGQVVTDDGRLLALPAVALVGSGLRFLRPGQRLTCLLTPDESGVPVVVAARINGIGEPLPE